MTNRGNGDQVRISLAPLVAAGALCVSSVGTAEAAPALTDITVISANSLGNSWLGLH